MERADLIINDKIKSFLSVNFKDDKEVKEILEKETISYPYLKELCLSKDNGIELLDDIVRSTHIYFHKVDSGSSAFPREEVERYKKLVGLNSEDIEDRVEWRHILRELSFILNGLFSVIGTGVAVFIIIGCVTDIKLEWRILISFLASFIVIIAELFLVIKFHWVSSPTPNVVVTPPSNSKLKTG